MRRRLVVGILVLTIAIIVIYAIPRGIYLAGYVRANEQEHVDRDATTIAEVVRLREAAGDPPSANDLHALVPDAEWAVYEAPDGTVVRASGTDGDRADDLVAERDLGDGRTLTVGRTSESVTREVVRSLMPLLLVGLVLIVGAFVAANVMSERLSRPFRALAGAAARLGTGDFDVTVPRSGIPEADAIGTALTESARDLHELVERERALTVHASHALRTPLTAMRLQVDDLATRGDLPDDVTEQLEQVRGEVERLACAVDDVLAFASNREATEVEDVELATGLRAVVDRWRGRTGGTGRDLTLGDVPAAVVHVAPGPFVQVLDALVHHLHDRGAGRITVSARELGGLVQVRVGDESGAADHADVFTRPALDATSGGSPVDDGAFTAMLVARGMAEAMGARLTLDAEAETTFVLTMRRG